MITIGVFGSSNGIPWNWKFHLFWLCRFRTQRPWLPRKLQQRSRVLRPPSLPRHLREAALARCRWRNQLPKCRRLRLRQRHSQNRSLSPRRVSSALLRVRTSPTRRRRRTRLRRLTQKRRRATRVSPEAKMRKERRSCKSWKMNRRTPRQPTVGRLSLWSATNRRVNGSTDTWSPCRKRCQRDALALFFYICCMYFIHFGRLGPHGFPVSGCESRR